MLSVPYLFHRVLPFITVLFSSEPVQDKTHTRLIEISLSYLRLVPVAIAVTMVRIGKRVHAQRSYLFPELLKHRPLTPLCRTHTDLKSVSMPCLCLCICAVVYDPNRGVSFLGFGLAGRLVPPIGSYGALTLEMSLERDQI